MANPTGSDSNGARPALLGAGPMSRAAYPPAAAAGRRQQRRQSTRRKLGMSQASIIGATASLVIGVLMARHTPEPELVFGAMALLALIFLTLWQENEPPLMMFPALYQWLAVSIKPLMTVFLLTPVNELAEFTDLDLHPAIWLGYGCIGLLAVGLRLGMGKPRQDWNAALRNEAVILTERSVLPIAIATILLGHLFYYLMRWVGPASQLFYALSNIRFAGLFALAYWAFVNRRGYTLMLGALMIEIVIGITGFFSDFRAPIFIIALAALAAGHRPKAREWVLAATLLTALIVLGSFWSEVKTDYRRMASGGTMEQVVVAPLEDRIGYLSNQAATFNSERFAHGFDLLLRRQSYVDYLAATIRHIPAELPFEHGKRISRTVIHVLTPRILFPDKAATEFDTDVTRYYTGISLYAAQSYTSISIGWAGEFYIDFGINGALICSLIMGFGIGFAYRLLRSGARDSLLLTYGTRSTLVVVLMSFETALIKYVGGAAIAFVGAYLVQMFIIPRLSRYLRVRAAYRRQPNWAGA